MAEPISRETIEVVPDTSRFFAALSQPIERAIDRTTKSVASAFSKIENTIAADLTAAGKAGGDGLASAVEAGTKSAAKMVGGAFDDVRGDVVDSLDDAGDRGGAALSSAVRAGAVEAAGRVESAFAGVGRQAGSRLARDLEAQGSRFKGAGEELGDEVAGGLEDALDGVSGRIGARVGPGFVSLGSSMGSKIVAGFAAVGIAAKLSDDFTDALDIEAGVDKLQAQLNLTADEAERIGQFAGDTFADAFGDSLDEVRGAYERTFRSFPDISDAALQEVAEGALTTADVFDQDFNSVVRAAQQLFVNGLAPSAEDALDTVATALQRTRGDQDEVLESINEYATSFAQVGLDGANVLGALTSEWATNQFAIDKVGDAVKEYGVRILDGSDTTKQALGDIGFSLGEVEAAYAEGGDAAEDMTSRVITAILDIEDPAQRSQAAVALLGEPFNDLGANAVPILRDVITGTSDLADTGDIAATAYDNAQTKIAGFFRGLKQQTVTVIGGVVIPAVDDAISAAGRFSDFASTVAAAVTAGDWPAVGAAIETGVDGALDALRGARGFAGDVIERIFGSDGPAGAVAAAVADGDWAAVGSNLSTAFVDAVERVDWQQLGDTIADGVVSAVDTLVAVGQDIASAIGDAITSIDWVSFGQATAPALLGFVVGLLGGLLDPAVWFRALIADGRWKVTVPTIIGFMFAPAKWLRPITSALRKIPFAGRLLGWAADALSRFGSQIGRFVGPAFAAFGRGFAAAFGRGGPGILARFSGVFDDVVVLARVWVSELGDSIIGGLTRLGGAVGGPLGRFVGAVNGFFGRLAATVARTIARLVAGVVGGFVRLLAAAVRPIAQLVARVAGFFGRLLADTVRTVGRLAGDVIDGFVRMAARVISAVADLVARALTAVGRFAARFASAVSDLVTSVLGFFAQLVARGVSTLTSGFTRMATTVATKLSGILVTVFRWVADVGRQLATLIGRARAIGGDMIAGLRNGISSAMSGIFNWLRDNVWQPIVSGVKRLFGINSPSTVFAGFGRDMIRGLIRGLIDNNPASFVRRVFGGVSDAAMTALGFLFDRGSIDLGALLDIPTKLLGRIFDAVGLGGLGALVGQDRSNSLLGISPDAAVARAYTALGRPGDVISGFRPFARTLSGGLSYHARGRALDITPQIEIVMAVIRRFMARTKELISPWAHLGVLNGRFHRFSEAVQAQHDGRTNVAHIHWAMREGGQLGSKLDFSGADDVIARLTRGEWVMPVRAVARYGPEFMSAVQLGRLPLPKFEFGGQVGTPDGFRRRLAATTGTRSDGPTVGSSGPSTAVINVTLPGGAVESFVVDLLDDRDIRVDVADRAGHGPSRRSRGVR